MPPTTLWLIRHGHAGPSGAVPGVFHGLTDLPLSPRGRRQAAVAAHALPRCPVTALYASDLARARATAAPVAAALGLEVTLLAALRERSFGAWEGRAVADLAREAPDALGALWSDPAFAPPGGESSRALADRVLGAVRAIVARHPGAAVALVGHGGPHRAVLGHALGLEPAAQLRLALDPGHAAVVRFFSDGAAEVAALNLPPAGWGDLARSLRPAAAPNRAGARVADRAAAGEGT